MPSYDELIHISAAAEIEELAKEEVKEKTFLDYLSLAVTTFGVGYIPLAPGTWGSAVGVLIYLIFRQAEAATVDFYTLQGFRELEITAFVHVAIAFLFLLFCLLGIW